MVSELPTMPMRLPLFGHIFSCARDPLGFFERASKVGPFVRVQLAGVGGVGSACRGIRTFEIASKRRSIRSAIARRLTPTCLACS